MKCFLLKKIVADARGDEILKKDFFLIEDVKLQQYVFYQTQFYINQIYLNVCYFQVSCRDRTIFDDSLKISKNFGISI